MNRKDFFDLVRKSLRMEKEDTDQLQWAYWLAKNAHRNQKRDGGERYFEHCRRVAVAFVEYKKIMYRKEGFIPIDDNCFLDDYEYVVIALLHDCIEDCFVPPQLLVRIFGIYVKRFVEILSKVKTKESGVNGKIQKIRKPNDSYYSKIIKGDFGIRIIKCLDRLDNLQDFIGWTQKRKKKYIAETEKYILPIAKVTDEKLFEALKAEIEKIKKKA